MLPETADANPHYVTILNNKADIKGREFTRPLSGGSRAYRGIATRTSSEIKEKILHVDYSFIAPTVPKKSV